MRESRTYGSVRGALSNERPYRVRDCLLHRMSLVVCRFLDAGNNETLRTLSEPASKKRQGRKSRSVVLQRRGGVYGDLAAEPEVPLGLERLRRWICRKVWVGVSVGTSGRHVAREDL